MKVPNPTAPLLDCPFCGHRAAYKHNPLYDNLSMARCTSCGAQAFWSKWNERVANTKQSG